MSTPALQFGPPGPPTHPIIACAGDVGAALAKVAPVEPTFMSGAEKRAAVLALDRDLAMLSELRLRVLAAADADDLGRDEGASSTAAWLAFRTRIGRAAAVNQLRLARALERHRATALAVTQGAVNIDQAREIVAALDRLPAALSADRVNRAESHLIGLAAEFDPAGLRRLGRHLYEVIDPEHADEELGRAVLRQEREAARRTRLTLHDNGDGTHSGSFTIPDLHASILRKVCQSMTAPRRRSHRPAAPDNDGADRGLPPASPLGRGFTELLERLPQTGLPRTAGISATVVVTIDLAQLRDELGLGMLDDGAELSAGEVRRLACEAGIIPVVLGGESEPLDVGRSRRLHSRAQRVAIALRDQRCLAEGCDRPASWCECHHETWWQHGGDTSVQNGGLRCSFHHHLEHDPAFVKTRLPDRRVRYHRRT